MKIEIKLGLNQSSITLLFFSGFLLGVVIAGVALLGSQIPLKCFEAGNAADWAAAAGTWVIGYGAWKYARVAHLQRVREHGLSERSFIEAKIRRFNMIYLKLIKVRSMGKAARHSLPKEASGPLQDPRINTSLYVVSILLKTIEWPAEEVVLLSLESQAALSRIERHLLAIDASIKIMKERDKDVGPFQFCADYAAISGSLRTCADEANALAGRVKARLKELEAEMDSLRI